MARRFQSPFPHRSCLAGRTRETIARRATISREDARHLLAWKRQPLKPVLGGWSHYGFMQPYTLFLALSTFRQRLEALTPRRRVRP